MERITIKTKKAKEIADITDEISKAVDKAGFKEGLCCLFALHTTACLTTADLDPGTDLDMLDAFEAMIPELKYRHPHDPSHVGDHIMSSMIGPFVAIPVKDGKLILGRWQRIVLVELNGPREREIIAHLMMCT